MKTAIVQPYFAPHLAYFQLINEVDNFVFYDDVNFIKRGWINRNYITINGNIQRFTIPLKKVSQNKKINEVEVDWEGRSMNKLIKTISQNLKDSQGMCIFQKIIESKPETISETCILSIKLACEYLEINTNLKKSSELNFNKHDDKVLNLVEICRLQNSSHYINPENGKHIYDKKTFLKHGIKLNFINGCSSQSILEVITSVKNQNQLKNYTLV